MTEKTKYRYLLSALRTFLMFTVFCLVSSIAGKNLRQSPFQKQVFGFWNEGRYCQANFFYSLLIFFSLASVFCIHHIYLKRDFVKKDRLESKFRFIITSGYFLTDIAVIAVCCVIFPSVPPFSDLNYGFLSAVPSGRQRLISTAVMLALTMIIEFAAYYSTVGWWSGQKKKFKVEEGDAPFFKFALQMILTSVIWAIAGSAVTLAVPMLATFFAIIGAAKIPIAILLVLLIALGIALSGLRYLGVVRQRKAFAGKLARVCEERGISLTVSGRPYGSASRSHEGSRIILRKDGLKLACRFISVNSKNSPLYLNEDGMATRVKERILFKHHVSESYSFDAEAEYQKILIVCPCKGDVYVKGVHGEHPIESGDKVMEYRVYNASGFISAIERELLG